MHFSRLTESDPFFQSVNNDVLANNIHTYMLSRSIRYAIDSPTVFETDSAITGCFKRTMVCWICLVLRSKAFTVLFFCVLRFSTIYYGIILRLQLTTFPLLPSLRENVFHKTRREYLILTESTLDQSAVVVKRSSGRKRY